MSDTTDTPEKTEVLARIHRECDDEQRALHVIHTGVADDGLRAFYLVLTQDVHDGRQMWGLRFFAIGLADGIEDTWMRNGVQARNQRGILKRLSDAFIMAHANYGQDRDPTYVELDVDE